MRINNFLPPKAPLCGHPYNNWLYCSGLDWFVGFELLVIRLVNYLEKFSFQ